MAVQKTDLDCNFVVTDVDPDSNAALVGIKVGQIFHVKSGKFRIKGYSNDPFPICRALTSEEDLIDYMKNELSGVTVSIFRTDSAQPIIDAINAKQIRAEDAVLYLTSILSVNNIEWSPDALLGD